MFRPLMVVLFAVLALPVGASAQLTYSHTTLVHGFNDDSVRFVRPNTSGLLGRDMNLKQVQTPSLGGYLSIDDQAANLRPRLFGSHVLAGLSMGGLTSRAAYFGPPISANVSAIITIATPHQGAPIADNASRTTGYLVSIVVDFFDSVIRIFNKPTPGNILNAVAVGLIHGIAREVLTDVVKVHIDAQLGVRSDGLRDIRVGSPTVSRLNGQIDALPHANVYGTIGRRNAAFRLGFSALYNDAGFEPFVRKKNRVKSVVKACRQIAWNIIVRLEVGRVCNQIDNALGSIDGRWAAWTMGAEARIPSATFDGLIPTSRSRYPGTSLSDPVINFPAPQANHMNIQYKREGTDAIVGAMAQVGMERATPPPGGGGGDPPPNPCPPPQLEC
ncbi:MAG: hypothetical protein ACR2L6_12480 [Gemmatimonadaceae bacterium]